MYVIFSCATSFRSLTENLDNHRTGTNIFSATQIETFLYHRVQLKNSLRPYHRTLKAISQESNTFYNKNGNSILILKPHRRNNAQPPPDSNPGRRQRQPHSSEQYRRRKRLGRFGIYQRWWRGGSEGVGEFDTCWRLILLEINRG